MTKPPPAGLRALCDALLHVNGVALGMDDAPPAARANDAPSPAVPESTPKGRAATKRDAHARAAAEKTMRPWTTDELTHPQQNDNELEATLARPVLRDAGRSL